MSAVLAPLAVKVVAGAVASKVVGKVTGNEKLGMIAGLATGAFLNPAALGVGAATTSAAGAGGGMGAGMMEAGVAATGAAVPTAAASAAPGLFSGMAGASLSGATGALASNPTAALIGSQAVMGAVQGYEQRKAEARARKDMLEVARLDREQQIVIEQMRNAEAKTAYERSHQSFAPGYGASRPTSLPSPIAKAPMAARPTSAPAASPAVAHAGMLPQAPGMPARPMTAPEQYHNRYNRKVR